MASRPLDGSAKCAAVVATTPRPNRGASSASAALRSSSSGMAVVGELDADPVRGRTGRPDRPAPFRGSGPPVGKRLADMAFATSGQDVPVPAGRLGERVVVVAQDCPSRRRPDVPRPAGATAVDTLGSTGQHQQMRPRRIGFLGAVAATEGQFGTEHRLHVEFLGGLGEAHHPVEPVVVGQRDGAQIEPGGLLDEFLRRAGAVEEAVGRMGMQLGIRDRRAGPLARPAADSSRACGTRPGCRRRRRSAHRSATRRAAACR